MSIGFGDVSLLVNHITDQCNWIVYPPPRKLYDRIKIKRKLSHSALWEAYKPEGASKEESSEASEECMSYGRRGLVV